MAVRSIVLAVGGGSGAGKSTLSETLSQLLNRRASTVTVPIEAYFRDWSELPIEERARRNFDEPAAVEVERLVDDLVRLRRGGRAHRPWYDMKLHARGQGLVLVEPADVVIVDGHLALALPECREVYDIAVFVDTSDDERLRRRIVRDVRERGRTAESVRDRWERSVQPMFHEYIAPSARWADLIVDGRRDPNQLAQQVIQHLPLAK